MKESPATSRDLVSPGAAGQHAARLLTRAGLVLLLTLSLALSLALFLGPPLLFCPALHAQSTPPAGGRPPHEPKHAEREQIEALEEQFRKAQLDDDIATMDKLLSEDYLGINANGELSTKTQQLDHMRNRSLVLTQLDPSDVKIKLIGSTAIVTSLVQVEGTLDGTALRGRYRYTRVYQRLPSGIWKVTNFETTRIRRPNE
jgi:ketosteroid isomerase-like protein